MSAKKSTKEEIRNELGVTQRNLFNLEKHGASYSREIYSGLLQFLAMLYIPVLVPQLLSQTGMPQDAVFTAVVISIIIGTVVLSLLSNLPLAVAPSLTATMLFVVGIVEGHGFSWQVTLLCVFLGGILVLVLGLMKFGDRMWEALPKTIQNGLVAGLGLLMARFGLEEAGILSIYDNIGFSALHFNTVTAIIVMLGFLIIVVCEHYKFRGKYFISMLFCWGVAAICQLVGIYKVTDVTPSVFTSGFFSIPASLDAMGGAAFDFESFVTEFGSISQLILRVAFFTITFFFACTLDNYSASYAMEADERNLHMHVGQKHKGIAVASGLATMTAGLVGAAPCALCIENLAGVKEGSKTGLSSLVVAVLFVLTLFMSPFFLSIPLFIVAPVMMYIGLGYLKRLTVLENAPVYEAAPALICTLITGFTCQAAFGFAIGIILYTALALICRKSKNLKPLTWILTAVAALFLVFCNVI